MVLQRPVACEQHASTAPWSPGADTPAPPWLEPLARSPRDAEAGREVEPLADSADGLPEAALFSRAEFRSLIALREKLRKQDLGGGRVDDALAPPGQLDDGPVQRQ